MKGNKIKKSTYLLVVSLAGVSVLSFFVVKGILLGNISDMENASDEAGLVYGEEEQMANGAKYKSENYNVPQIGTGSVVLNYTSDENQWPLDIEDTKNEIFSDKDKNYKKLSLSWKTTKPTRCELRYSKAGTPDAKVYKEDDYTINHSVIIEKLESASTYNYSVVARDRWGNELESDKFAVYTGAPELSFLDLLGGAFKEVFGWAIK